MYFLLEKVNFYCHVSLLEGNSTILGPHMLIFLILSWRHMLQPEQLAFKMAYLLVMIFSCWGRVQKFSQVNHHFNIEGSEADATWEGRRGQFGSEEQDMNFWHWSICCRHDLHRHQRMDSESEREFRVNWQWCISGSLAKADKRKAKIFRSNQILRGVPQGGLKIQQGPQGSRSGWRNAEECLTGQVPHPRCAPENDHPFLMEGFFEGPL